MHICQSQCVSVVCIIYLCVCVCESVCVCVCVCVCVWVIVSELHVLFLFQGDHGYYVIKQTGIPGTRSTTSSGVVLPLVPAVLTPSEHISCVCACVCQGLPVYLGPTSGVKNGCLHRTTSALRQQWSLLLTVRVRKCAGAQTNFCSLFPQSGSLSFPPAETQRSERGV